MTVQKKVAAKITATMDKVGIEKAIGSIKTRGLSLDRDIQLTGLSIIAHVEANGEVSLFKKLHDAMPAGSRRNALVAWVLAYSQVAVNFDKKTKGAQPFVFNKEGATDLEGATLKPWFLFKKEAAPSEEFNLDKALAKFQAMVQKQVKAGKLEASEDRVATILAIHVEKEGTIGALVSDK